MALARRGGTDEEDEREAVGQALMINNQSGSNRSACVLSARDLGGVKTVRAPRQDKEHFRVREGMAYRNARKGKMTSVNVAP